MHLFFIFKRYCNEQKRNLLEEICLRAIGTGGVDLINPAADISQAELEAWSAVWGKQVIKWMGKFLDDNVSGIIRLAENWGR